MLQTYDHPCLEKAKKLGRAIFLGVLKFLKSFYGSKFLNFSLGLLDFFIQKLLVFETVVAVQA